MMGLQALLRCLSLRSCFKSKQDILLSISSVVELKVEIDNHENQQLDNNVSDDKSDITEEDTDTDTDVDKYECVVCRQECSGEHNMEEHRRIFQHWG